MSTALWIKLGLWLFSKWLMKQNEKDEFKDRHPLVQNLLTSRTSEDLLNIVTDDTTEEAVLEIIADAKGVKIGDVVEKMISDLVKK